MRTHKQPNVVPVMMPPDPADPVQSLDETQDFHLEPLDVNVMPGAEQQEDIDAELGEAEVDDDEDLLDDSELTDEQRTAKADDIGELYGVHLPPADDPDRGAGPDLGEYAAAELGENWLETLETGSAEGGPVPEREVDPNDESDHETHHSTESGDRPVADKGSGGPAGL